MKLFKKGGKNMETNKTGIMEKIYKTYIEYLSDYLSYESVSELYEYLDDILPSWRSGKVYEKAILKKDARFLWNSIMHDPIVEKINEIEDLDYDKVTLVQYDIIDRCFFEEYVPFVESLGFSPWWDDTYVGVELSNFYPWDVFVINEEEAWDRIENNKAEIALCLLEKPALALDIEKLTKYLMKEGILSDEFDNILEINPRFLEKVKEVDAFLDDVVLDIKESIKEWAENNFNLDIEAAQEKK